MYSAAQSFSLQFRSTSLKVPNNTLPALSTQEGTEPTSQEGLPALPNIMADLSQPHIMATPTGGFPLGLVAHPRAEKQGENLGFWAKVGEFEALPPAAVAPPELPGIQWREAPLMVSAPAQNFS